MCLSTPCFNQVIKEGVLLLAPMSFHKVNTVFSTLLLMQYYNIRGDQCHCLITPSIYTTTMSISSLVFETKTKFSHLCNFFSDMMVIDLPMTFDSIVKAQLIGQKSCL